MWSTECYANRKQKYGWLNGGHTNTFFHIERDESKMSKICDFKLAQKLMESKHRGLMIGLAIGIIVCLIVVGLIIKICWLKKKFECLHYDLDDLDCELDETEDCDCDENGCSYTSEKDFV